MALVFVFPDGTFYMTSGRRQCKHDIAPEGKSWEYICWSTFNLSFHQIGLGYSVEVFTKPFFSLSAVEHCLYPSLSP